ncbi:hypothetical protein [Acinetobacter baumannii]|uniref:hypothetical protein n=1 Tax=Acinetobacter baumannii TaxID=470 RepID=UPI0012EC5C29|nr:hypothetical protein [Acinetobacter baumannii]MDM8379130.1 hypothetical protein [Acinetobacter baumannii]MDM8390593.1 hypothetical protein [Acinetobacter baumannii]MDM8468964.1 hypothetical protein [Acinetobacter baumannii]QJH19825.1 hypothetical protein HBK86_10210 [Acinetobacter baumannii]
MPHSRLTLPLVSVGLFMLSGCTGEDGGFNVGVTLGGTGTGEMMNRTGFVGDSVF